MEMLKFSVFEKELMNRCGYSAVMAIRHDERYRNAESLINVILAIFEAWVVRRAMFLRPEASPLLADTDLTSTYM